ncbi:hypothetical protein [Prescottella equi]|uniref:hypothetical protein n=1 Tax=Rhodococcus hoagii TaxID=43767 RepID=UPI001EECAFFB|nr:hypothetical protein [Prescottella equi]
MAYKGSRTKTTAIWLAPEDEVRVGRAIADAAPSAAWLCSPPGPAGLHPVHLHRNLEQAFECGPVQAFLLLPFAAAPPGDVEPDADVEITPALMGQALVQLLRSPHVDDEWSRSGEHGKAFSSGRLAVRWSEPEVGPDEHRLLSEQTDIVWAAMRWATRPARLLGPGGRVSTAGRIGQAAYDMVTTTGIPLTRGGPERCALA